MQLFVNCLVYNLQLIVCEGGLILGEPRRKYFWLRFLGSFAVCVLFSWGLLSIPANVPLLGALYFILIFFATMGVYALSFRLGVRDVIFFCTGGYAVQHAVYNAIGIILFFTGMPDTTTPAGAIEMWLLVQSLGYILAAIVCWLFMRKIRANNILDKKNAGVIVLSAIILFTVVIVSQLKTYSFGDMPLNMFTSSVVCGLYAIISCSVVLIMQFIILNMNRIVSDSEMQKHIFKLQREQCNISSDIYEAVNVKFHDIKHQLARFELMDEDKRKRAVEEIMQSIEGFSALVKTDNPSLNVVLTEKNLLCKKSGIMLNSFIDCSLSFMSELDIFTLFGNALDNAINSAGKQEGERRTIDLYIRKKGGMSFINIYNYYSGEIKFENGLPVTKGNKLYHGFGTRSIVDTVRKYGGEFVMTTEGDQFRLSITFPHV